MNKLSYFGICLSKRLRGLKFDCPSCGNGRSRRVARKFLVTELMRCESCALMFRVPTTTVAENAKFYQESYRQGFTSDTPTDDQLDRLLVAGFRGSEKDYSIYLAVLKALGATPGQRLLDFGCSWGYGSWQMAQAGYKVSAFEISRARCAYARQRLGVDAHFEIDRVPLGPFDVFFSAHVLEHVPSVESVFRFAASRLKPGGLFVAFTPNGSEAFRQTNPAQWQKLWNMVHPNFLDDVFYRKRFPDSILASNPYDLNSLASWTADRRGAKHDLSGIELLVATRSTGAQGL